MPNVGEAAYQSGSERGLWSEARARFPVLPLPKWRLTQDQVSHLSELQLSSVGKWGYEELCLRWLYKYEMNTWHAQSSHWHRGSALEIPSTVKNVHGILYLAGSALQNMLYNYIVVPYSEGHQPSQFAQSCPGFNTENLASCETS